MSQPFHRGRPCEPSWPHGQALAPNHPLTVRSHVPGEVVAPAEYSWQMGHMRASALSLLEHESGPARSFLWWDLMWKTRSEVRAEGQVALGTPVLGGQAQGGERRGQQGPRAGRRADDGRGGIWTVACLSHSVGAQGGATERSIWWHCLQVQKSPTKSLELESRPQPSDINRVDESQQLSRASAGSPA